MRYIFAFLATLLSLACQSWQASEWREPADGRLATLQAQRRYTEIVGLLSSLDGSRSDMRLLRHAALEGIQKEYLDAVDEASYRRQLHYQRSLVLLDEDFVPEFSEAELLRAIVLEEYLAEGQHAAVLAMLSKTALEVFAPDELQSLLALCRRYRAAQLGQRIRDLLESKGAAVEDAASDAVSPPDFDTLFKGVVTVIVDEGLEITRGFGRRAISGGSGFFIQEDGYILTNYHVVEAIFDEKRFSRLSVQLSGAHELPVDADIVAYDEVFDLALLKVEMTAPQVFALSAARKPELAEAVFVLGSPLGLRNTLTSGIVSVNERIHFLQMGDELQYDAPTNPGNSGGPLVAADGTVLGLAYAKIFGFEGINFAIPSYWVQFLLPRLFDAEGAIAHHWLGLGVADSFGDLEVRYVAPDSPAEYAGMRRGDVLLSVNDVAVENPRSVQEQLLVLQEGSLVKLRYLRGAEQQESLLALAQRPLSPTEYGLRYDDIEAFFPLLFGMRVRRVEEGFLVDELLSSAADGNSGIEEGDLFKVLSWHMDTDEATLELSIKFLSSSTDLKKLTLYRRYYDAEHYI